MEASLPRDWLQFVVLEGMVVYGNLMELVPEHRKVACGRHSEETPEAGEDMAVYQNQAPDCKDVQGQVEKSVLFRWSGEMG